MLMGYSTGSKPRKLKLSKELIECPFCHHISMREDIGVPTLLIKKMICNDCECWFLKSE